MYLTLINHEIKNFFRNPSFATNIIIKILMWFGWLSMALSLMGMAVGLFFYTKEEGINTIALCSRYFIYVWVGDLILRYIIQQMPTNNIKPYLTLNITKDKLVKYSIVKTLLYFFNWSYLLIFLPVFILLITHEYSVLGAVSWSLALFVLLLSNNFLNIILNGKKYLIIALGFIAGVFFLLEKLNVFSITEYSKEIFIFFYDYPLLALIPIIILMGLIYFCYHLIYSTFYLDAGLAKKGAGRIDYNVDFLNQYGTLGVFLKNDIRLILRNKQPRQVLLTGVMFLFYGLLAKTGGSYEGLWFKFLAGLIITGGFSMTFGAKVPSWDSSYYSLMLTQNVPYRKYLESKWWLMIIATVVSIVLASFYLFIEVEFYLIILVAGIYNLGINNYLTLLGGAFMKTPVDLNAKAKSFGQKNAFNFKVILLAIPKILFPMVLFLVLYNLVSSMVALIAVAAVGILGFLFKNKIFNNIIKIYKSEKYMTLEAYKNKV